MKADAQNSISKQELDKLQECRAKNVPQQFPRSIADVFRLEDPITMVCVMNRINPRVTTRYLAERLWMDEVLRSEAAALGWAETKYNREFRTGIMGGDLISIDGEILVEVTVQNLTNGGLRSKVRKSAESAIRLDNRLQFSVVVGVRVDPDSNFVVDYVEFNWPE